MSYLPEASMAATGTAARALLIWIVLRAEEEEEEVVVVAPFLPASSVSLLSPAGFVLFCRRERRGVVCRCVSQAERRRRALC
nr:unnamed protein product [Digitaria exilis]